MKIDPDKICMMPLIMGPVEPERQNRVGRVYGEVEYVGLQYQTDPDAIRVLLPDCYRPAEKPTVAVMFCYNDGVDFLAGRGYRIATVSVGARFDGEQDHVEGDQETGLEVLSALRQLVGSKLLSQLWNGFERLSFGLHYGVALMPNVRVVI
jgi:hypothetical protein